MRKSVIVLWVALVALACAGQESEYDISFEEVEISNFPTKFSLDGATGVSREVVREVLKRAKLPLGFRGITANLDDYADQIFTNIDNLMIHGGFDPMQMPEVHEGFNFTLLLIRYHGELDLTKGWLSDTSTLHRGDGDVVVSYEHATKRLELTIPIAFNDLMFSFDYSAKLMNLGPKGGIEGKIKDLKLEVTLSFDWDKLEASLDTFYITNSGHITFRFTGNVLVDWVLNILSEVVTTVLKKVILLVVEGLVRGALDAVVNIVNEAVDSVLHPQLNSTTLPVPATTVPSLVNY